MFKGSITALPTPFRDSQLDEGALRALVDWQIREGADGLIALGTTGEAPTLTEDETSRVIELTIAEAAGRVPVMVGTGGNSTTKTIEMTRRAAVAGADAALIITPYYNKPTQEGLYAHYKAICDAVDLPIIIYNNPARTSVDMTVDLILRLVEEEKNIVGMKDSNPDLKRTIRLHRKLGSRFFQLSGDEPTGLPFMLAGGVGVTSSIGNIVPRMLKEMLDAWQRKDIARAMDLYARMTPLFAALYVETNPVPVKYGLSLLNRMSPEVRLPLCELRQSSKDTLRAAMVDCGALEH